MATYDVAVIGAGVHGASAALHLAERGASVLLIDKDVPASGPTGRSSALLRGYYVNEFLARATRESMDLFESFTDWTHGGEARRVRCGALFLHDDGDEDKLRAACDRLNAIGTVTSVLSRDDLAAEFPMFDLNGVGWAVWEPNAGHADPAGTTNGMANRAQQLGATLQRHTRIADIHATPSGYTLKSTDGESFEATKVLVAAGPWTGPLLELLDVSVPLWAERHIIATYRWGEAPQFPFIWASIPDGIYVKPELHAQYLVGTLLPEPRVDPDDFDEQLAPAEQVRITGATVGRFPRLEDSEALSGYASVYDVAPDWQPVIGEVRPGAFVVAGTAGHGFKWAPALGRHIADLVTGAAVDPGLAQFHPDRFAEGHHLDAGYGEARILG